MTTSCLTPVLALTLADIGIWALTVVGMAVVGVVAWRRLQSQEAGDRTFLKRLDDDDARADEGRR